MQRRWLLLILLSSLLLHDAWLRLGPVWGLAASAYHRRASETGLPWSFTAVR